MTSLYEQYRPVSFDQVIGQDKAIRALSLLRTRGLGGRAIWLTGPSGTGKTTLARLVAAEIADEWSTIEVDATGLAVRDLERLEKQVSNRALGKGGWALMVNEAHGLTPACVRALLVMLERIPRHVVWLFTSTVDGLDLFGEKQDAHPLLSRANHIGLSQRGLAEAFARRAREIAQAAGLDGKPIEAYIRLVKECRNNMRAVLSAIETGAMMP